MARFFSDPDAFQKAVEKAGTAYLAAIKSTDPAMVRRAPIVFATALTAESGNVIAKRTLELLDQLEARIAELEKTPFSYDGPHEQSKSYTPGTFVTHDGSLWHCNVATVARPGDGHAWTLAVKRGRDGKDGR